MPETFAQALQGRHLEISEGRDYFMEQAESSLDNRSHTGGRAAVADIRLQRTKRTLPETAAAEKLFQRPGFRPIFMRVSAAVSLK